MCVIEKILSFDKAMWFRSIYSASLSSISISMCAVWGIYKGIYNNNWIIILC